MRKILILGLLLLLPACSTTQTFFDGVKAAVTKVVTPDNLDSITIAYAAVSGAGNTYRNSCERKLINKSCWKVIATLQPYEQKAYDSYVALWDFVKLNPNGDAATLIQLARAAIDVATSKQIQNGVK